MNQKVRQNPVKLVSCDLVLFVVVHSITFFHENKNYEIKLYTFKTCSVPKFLTGGAGTQS